MREPGAGGQILPSGVRFDARSGDLSGPLGSTRLAPQPAALLALLAEEGAGVVSRDRVREHLWPGGRVEFDQGIGFAVAEIRRGIASVGGDPAIIETLPRRGFRLRPAPPGDSPSAPLVGQAEVPEQGVPHPGRRRWIAAAVALIGALGVVFLLPGGEPLPVLVIFPYDSRALEDVTGPGVEAGAVGLGVSEGLTAALTTEWAGRVGVVGPGGTVGIDGPGDTEAARARLGACAILSGSILPLEDRRVEVFSQLVDARSRVHLWASKDTLSIESVEGGVLARVLEGMETLLEAC